jgi:hypothetical protein
MLPADLTKARNTMSKYLIAKLSVTVATLSALTLLQGCSKEVSDDVLKAAWLPVGSQLPLGTEFLPIANGGTGASAGAGQSTGSGAAGAAAGAGGGNQVSSGAVAQ